MAPFVSNEAVVYIVLALGVLWRLPDWGRKILAFLRDLRTFRHGE